MAGGAVQRGDVCITLMEQPRTFEVEDSEFLCLRRLGWRRCCCCFCPSVTSPLVWGGWDISAGFTSPCSGVSPGAGCWSLAVWSGDGRGRKGLKKPRREEVPSMRARPTHLKDAVKTAPSPAVGTPESAPRRPRCLAVPFRVILCWVTLTTAETQGRAEEHCLQLKLSKP